MELTDALLESWSRQTQIVDSVAGRIDETNRHALPSPDGWPLDRHLAHIHEVRYFWLSKVSPEHAATLGESFEEDGETPLPSLDAIREELAKSGRAVGEAFLSLLERGVTSVGGYDHPLLFLQHMVWHEGWHVGLLFLGLRLAGQEPAEEWEEENVWGVWRTEAF